MKIIESIWGMSSNGTENRNKLPSNTNIYQHIFLISYDFIYVKLLIKYFFSFYILTFYLPNTNKSIYY